MDELKNIKIPRGNGVLPCVGSSFSFEKLLKTIARVDPEAKYQLQYTDYEENQWTAPCLILNHRIEQMANDNSVKRIFIEFSNGTRLVVFS
jgi:hypothetical protein